MLGKNGTPGLPSVFTVMGVGTDPLPVAAFSADMAGTVALGVH
ncbi:hypothetical protein [Ostreiculturibacter nitratireducens]